MLVLEEGTCAVLRGLVGIVALRNTATPRRDLVFCWRREKARISQVNIGSNNYAYIDEILSAGQPYHREEDQQSYSSNKDRTLQHVAEVECGRFNLEETLGHLKLVIYIFLLFLKSQ